VSAPTNITYRRKARELVVTFADAEFALPAEYLRVYSPSAEVRGHGPEERKLVAGKKHVAISDIEAVGNYAIRISFDDGHDTGLYAWEYLRELNDSFDAWWGEYLKELKLANASRLPSIPMTGGPLKTGGPVNKGPVGSWTP